MSAKTLAKLFSSGKTLLRPDGKTTNVRNVIAKPSGALLPEPKILPFGIVRIFTTVIPGLLIGAAISKTIANFLEENDLFVPSDDDDDDD